MGQIDSHPIGPLTKTYFQKTPRLNRVDNKNRKKYVEKKHKHGLQFWFRYE